MGAAAAAWRLPSSDAKPGSPTVFGIYRLRRRRPAIESVVDVASILLTLSSHWYIHIPRERRASAQAAALRHHSTGASDC